MTSQRKLPLRRRLLYFSIIYFAFLLLLLAVEGITRLTLPHVSSLDLFVNTTQQRAQVARPEQALIFEGDPLLLWRLKPNLNRVIWDFTDSFFERTESSERLRHPGEETRNDSDTLPRAFGHFRLSCAARMAGEA